MQNQINRLDAAFPLAAAVAVEFIQRDEVRGLWLMPSVLPKAVRRLLLTGTARDVVPIPWQGWSLRRDDFLLTRMLEIVVHADDLALSAGVRTPEFPAEVFAPVCDLLVRLAVQRHGQSAVISTLTRRERTQPISAF